MPTPHNEDSYCAGLSFKVLRAPFKYVCAFKKWPQLHFHGVPAPTLSIFSVLKDFGSNIQVLEEKDFRRLFLAFLGKFS